MLRPFRTDQGDPVELFDELFSLPSASGSFIARYAHILFGITWIGLLYFFNFVQVPAYAQLSDGARSEALRNVTWRALWWFRWAALATFLSGLLILIWQDQISDGDYWKSAPGISISIGILFGTTMFLNVWGVIWRNQKIVIGSARAVAEGGEANPDAPAAAKKAARASRANTFFSFTMLWFMVFTSHFSFEFNNAPESGDRALVWLIVLVLWAFVELSALGVLGGIDSPQNKLMFDNHRNTIIGGFIYLAVIYFVCWEGIIGGS
jgi:uncharacterized membrane protein